MRGSGGGNVEKKSELEHSGPLAVWTTGVWQREGMAIRWLEKRVVDMVTRWTDDAERRSGFQDRFAQPLAPREEETVLRRLLNIVRRK